VCAHPHTHTYTHTHARQVRSNGARALGSLLAFAAPPRVSANDPTAGGGGGKVSSDWAVGVVEGLGFKVKGFLRVEVREGHAWVRGSGSASVSI
jgi:hypothetical protein